MRKSELGKFHFLHKIINKLGQIWGENVILNHFLKNLLRLVFDAQCRKNQYLLVFDSYIAEVMSQWKFFKKKLYCYFAVCQICHLA